MINKHDKDKLMDSFGHFALTGFLPAQVLLVHLVDVSINIVQVCVLYKVEKQLITNKGQSLFSFMFLAVDIPVSFCNICPAL